MHSRKVQSKILDCIIQSNSEGNYITNDYKEQCLQLIILLEGKITCWTTKIYVMVECPNCKTKDDYSRR